MSLFRMLWGKDDEQPSIAVAVTNNLTKSELGKKGQMVCSYRLQPMISGKSEQLVASQPQ